MNTDASGEHGPLDDPLAQARKDLSAAEHGLRGWQRLQAGEHRVLGEMLDVIRQINAELDVDRVLGVAARRIIDIFEAERVFLIEVGPGGEMRFRLAVDMKGRAIERPDAEVSRAVIGDVVGRRAPMLVSDAAKDPRFAGVSSVRHLGLHSVMVAPLMAGAELLGVVYADNRLLAGAFDEHTLDLLGIFSHHVGIALRNAHLFRDLDAARSALALAERLKAIGEVATFVAHEIKNPLGSVKIMLGELKERGDDDALRAKVLEAVLDETSRLNRAAEQILQYARPTSLVKVPVSLPMLVESALRTLQAEMERGKVRVVREFEQGLPPVLADGERVRQVFINLLRNGLDALSGRPDPELRVSVEMAQRAREEVVVQDNGPGIPADRLPVIFEPFRTFKESGTGLGLALCQKLLREHGGDITAENVPSGGARFRMNFPIEKT